MSISTRDKAVLVVALVFVGAIVILQFSGNLVQSPAEEPEEGGGAGEGVVLTLLENAGLMIEAGGMRIYIDPIELPQGYEDLQADAILVTHDHGDHYHQSTIRMLQKEGTVNVFPAIMEHEIQRHDGTGVVPGDVVEIGEVTITAFYMYTFSPTGGETSHPRESEYCGYIVDLGGFTIFHAGDSKNIPEYEDLAGTIDVACLPLGPGCQTMADSEIVDAIRVIEPSYFVPIHFMEGDNERFCSRYTSLIESADCEVCNLDHYTSNTFEIS